MMNDQPLTYSPFSALDTKEKVAQWICLQCSHAAEEASSTNITEIVAQTGSLAHAQYAEVQEAEEKKPLSVIPPARHGQYDAVIRRMKTAQRQTNAYITCTESF